MKLAVVADVHLDTTFSGLNPKAATARRENLKKSLESAVDVARAEGADAFIVCGDLYEQERFSADTARFLVRVFESFAPKQVVVAPGNHDWWGPRSLYSIADWSSNVHIVESADLQPFALEDGLYLWGAAHQAPRTERNLLEGFAVPGEGIHIGVLHGSETSRFSREQLADPDKFAHAPFRESDVERAGLAHVFAGHYHRASSTALCTYPGNPDPLTFGEDRALSPRGLVFATIGSSGTVEVEPPRDVSVSRVFSVEVDCAGTSDRRDLIDRVLESVVEATGGQTAGSFVRVSLAGTVAPEVDVDSIDEIVAAELVDAAGVWVDAGRLRRGVDYGAFESEQSVRGEFIRAVLAAADLDDRLKDMVIETGLAALEGWDFSQGGDTPG